MEKKIEIQEDSWNLNAFFINGVKIHLSRAVNRKELIAELKKVIH